MRVGYLGPPGTFSHEALPPDCDGIPLPTLRDVVLAVQEGTVDRSLAPIENALEGSVGVVLDTLVLEAPDVEIVGELVHPVRHCLLAAAGVALDDIRVVVTHPQASGQCARFIREHLASATVVAAASTADAARLVAEDAVGGGPAAALGTRAAAARYGCVVLREGVEDHPDNATRFVWLARAAVGGRGGGAAQTEGRGGAGADGRSGAPARPHKTALVFWGAGADSPGWLVRCLSEFAFRGVNLTRIESRPRREGLGAYMFFLDLEGAVGDAAIGDAVAGLRAQTDAVRVLGSFPRVN